MEPPRAARVGVLLLALLTGCGPAGSPTPSVQPELTLHDVNVEPLEKREAEIGMAFDVQAAAELVADVPDDLDFGSTALVCVYLGERPTTGWGLALQTASLASGELTILARETRPRANARQETTYPADCGTLNRDALPPGELVVRAHDTISDEFITEGRVTVPPREAAP
ncbi:MAG TPA: protease complex subunit PrcB family protein [candidate division Zixibacteria bacterium]|nr:protease complex subunit PrcB family protein [candidate division Zixibacteria bacterium]